MSGLKLLNAIVEERLPFLEPQTKGKFASPPEPNQPSSNAARSPPGRKIVARRDHEYMVAELQISGYSFMPSYSPCFHELVGTEARQPMVNIAEERTEFPDSKMVPLTHYLLCGLLVISLGTIHPHINRGQKTSCVVMVSDAPSIPKKC